MAAHAQAVNDRAEAEKVLGMVPLKHPDAPFLPMKMPSPDEIRLFRVTPASGRTRPDPSTVAVRPTAVTRLARQRTVTRRGDGAPQPSSEGREQPVDSAEPAYEFDQRNAW